MESRGLVGQNELILCSDSGAVAIRNDDLEQVDLEIIIMGPKRRSNRLRKERDSTVSEDLMDRSGSPRTMNANRDEDKPPKATDEKSKRDERRQRGDKEENASVDRGVQQSKRDKTPNNDNLLDRLEQRYTRQSGSSIVANDDAYVDYMDYF